MDMQRVIENQRYEVLTTDGFKDYDGITMVERDTYELVLSNTSVIGTLDHLFFVKEVNDWVEMGDILGGQYVQTVDGYQECIEIRTSGRKMVSDLINVRDVHSFIANGINAHNCLYLDELGFVEPHIAREMWTSLSPTLSTGGKCIITSTPNVEDDVFADIWFGALDNIDEYGNEKELGRNDFKPYFADWTAHPDRDQAWADGERGAVGDAKFRREHLCQFVTFEETLINSTALIELKGKEPAYRTGNIRWYKDIDPNCTYLVGLDPSMGTGGDFAAIQVIELPTMEQVAEWQHNRTRVEDQVMIMRDITKDIEQRGAYEVYWSVENNSLGEAALVVIRDLGEETFAGSMLHDPVNRSASRRKGFTTTPRSKQETCAMLKRLIERNTLKINSLGLVAELKTFISAGGTYRAKNGTHDDLVMALILVLRMSQFIATWDDKAQNALRSIDADEDDEDDYDSPMPFSFL